jgi:hypothetical protein
MINYSQVVSVNTQDGAMNGIIVYPNPASDIQHIKAGNETMMNTAD